MYAQYKYTRTLPHHLEVRRIYAEKHMVHLVNTLLFNIYVYYVMSISQLWGLQPYI